MSSDALGSIWTRPAPGARGAAHSREQIAAAAIAIADRDGVKAISMRRVAAEIGAGTMTLYHYVRSKDELYALVEDAIMGELVIPAERMPDDWRVAITEIATRSRDALIRHPWTFDVPRHGTSGGPNGTLHFEQSLSAASGTGLGRFECLEIVTMIDDYVFGYALRTNMMVDTAGDDPAAIADEWAAVIAEQVRGLDPEAFPHIHELFAGDDPKAVLTELIAVARDHERFLRGLNLMLDGIERRIAAAS